MHTTNSNDTPSTDAVVNREKLLDRIRKLYAMGQETDASPHEAEIAMRRCQSLMARFGIREDDLQTSEFETVEIDLGRQVATHVSILGAVSAELHDCLFVISRRRRGPVHCEFRGYAIDASVARLTFDYLQQALEGALRRRKRDGSLTAGRSASYDYRVSYCAAVQARISAITAERRVARPSDTGGTALVVRKFALVEARCGAGLRRQTVARRAARDADAVHVGRSDGQSVSLDTQLGRDAEREPTATVPHALPRP